MAQGRDRRAGAGLRALAEPAAAPSRARRLSRPLGRPGLLPGRLHAGLHAPVLLLPRRGRPTRRARRRGARDLAAVGRLARALPRRARAHGAAARRPRPTMIRGLRRRRPRRPRPPLDLHRRPRRDRALPPRRPARAPLQGRRGAEALAASGARRGARLSDDPTSVARAIEPVELRGRPAGTPARRRVDRGRTADRAAARADRDPPLRRPRLAGARAARAIGRSPTTPAATASPIPPRPSRLLHTRARRRPRGGARRRGGRQRRCSPATRWGPTPRSRTRFARRPGRRGWCVIGPAYIGVVDEEALANWDRLADGLERGGVEGFMEAYDRGCSTRAWRETVLRITRRRMVEHSPPEAVAGPCARCRARRRSRRSRSSSLATCRRSSSQATTRPTRDPTRSPRRGRSASPERA